MKKLLSYVSIILAAAVIMTGCSKNSPKAVATTFLNSYYHLDYEAAKKVSTEETKNTLNMMQQLSATFFPDSMKKAAKDIKVNVMDVKEEGDKATVKYNTSTVPTEQQLHLVKEKGKWLVQWTKADQMNGAGGGAADSTGAEQEPAMSDSAAGPAPDGAANAPDTGTAK